MQVNGEAGERRLLSYSPMMGTRGLLQDSSASDECMGIHEYSQAECGYRPGYTQALSGTAIHQARQCYRRDNGCVGIPADGVQGLCRTDCIALNVPFGYWS